MSVSEVHNLVLPVVARTATSGRRPKGRPASHPAVWDPDRISLTPEASEDVVRVYVFGKDVILRAGVVSQLRRSRQILLAEESRPDSDAVAIVVADELDDEVTSTIQKVHRLCTPRILLITNQLGRRALDAAFEAGTRVFVLRSEAHHERLAETVRDLAEADEAPASLDEALGHLAEVVTDDRPPLPARPAGLCDRDMEVLRLMADGHTTAGIARDLAYSESTIKNIIHAIVRELGARNRAHAVAMAMRSALI
jgi:DNA-binding NarL/FixJ family response regulator